jgi:hypothetical protein
MPASRSLFCACLLLALSPQDPGPTRAMSAGRMGHAQPAVEAAAASGMGWIENHGQWDESLHYVGRVGSAWIGAQAGALLLWLPAPGESSSVVRLSFDAPAKPLIEPRETLPGIYSYFRGNDPSRWVRGAPSFGEIVYRGVRPGIDLAVRGDERGIKYDLLVAPGADLASLRLRCEGGSGLWLEEEGTLVIETAAGPLRHAPGRSWQVLPSGEEREIVCRARLLDETSFGFEAVGYDPRLPLVIDPGLRWSTFLGSPTYAGTGDAAYGAASDSNGDVTVVGKADWIDFPTTPGAYQHPGPSTIPAAGDVFVTRLRGLDGTLLFSSLIGGSNRDEAKAVAVDAQDRPVLCGQANSKDFPTTSGVFDPTKDSDGSFILRLSATGDDLEYSTFIESTVLLEALWLEAIAVDKRTGSAIVAGQGHGAGLPTTAGTFMPVCAGDGFVARIAPDASAIEWATCIGGSTVDVVHAVAVDGEGRVAVTGETKSANYPTTPGAFQTQIGHPQVTRTAFVSVFASDGSKLDWSSYLGGKDPISSDLGYGVAFDPQDGLIVSGVTSSPTFPTTAGAWQPALAGYGDLFFTRFTPDGSALVSSTFFGGVDTDWAFALAVDSSGVATATGITRVDLPAMPGAFQTKWGGSFDPFVVRMNPRGTRLLYASYIGGDREDWAFGLAVTPSGRTTIAGLTFDGGTYPTTPNALSPTYNGGQMDAIVSTLDPYLEGVRPIGDSAPSCTGPLRLNAWQMPVAGDPDFGVYCSGAPPLASGWLLIGNPAPWPVLVNGLAVWIALGQPTRRVPIVSDADGYVEIPLSLSSLSRGQSSSMQCFFAGTPSCGGLGSWSASNGITITAQ